MTRSALFSRILDVLAAVGVLVGLYFAFQVAPEEATMGPVQRIFYFHVPFAIGCFLAFGVVLVASIGFLANGRATWDGVAVAAVEVGLLYCTLVLLTGPVWARSAWGVWWTWDARLTSTLVLWLIYASYLFLRTYMQDDPRVRRYAAVLGILGALNVPIVYYSAKWFRTQHPEPFITDKTRLDPTMGKALLVCMVAVLCLMVSLMLKRWTLEQLRSRREQLADRVGGDAFDG